MPERWTRSDKSRTHAENTSVLMSAHGGKLSGCHTPIAVPTVMSSRGLVDFAYPTVPGGSGQFLDLVPIAMSVGFLEGRTQSARARNRERRTCPIRRNCSRIYRNAEVVVPEDEGHENTLNSGQRNPGYKQQDVLEGGEQCYQLHSPLSTIPRPYDEYL